VGVLAGYFPDRAPPLSIPGSAAALSLWKILLAEFFGDLRAQKLRAGLTMFAMTWGTIAIVLLLSFGEGLKVAISTGLLNAGDRLFMVYGGTTSKEWEGLGTGRRVRLREADLTLLQRSIPEIDLVSPSYGGGHEPRAGRAEDHHVHGGVDPAFSERSRMSRGRRALPEPAGTSTSAAGCCFSGTIVERLFGDQDRWAGSCLDGLPFTVVGVMQKKFQDSSNNGPDADRAIIPASTFQTIYGPEFVGHLLIRPRDARQGPDVKQRLYDVLGRRYQFDPSDVRALSMWDFIADKKETDAIGLGIQIFLGLVGAFTLIVAGVGVANIMYVVVRERTREIGIKRAVGARRPHIMAQFVAEACSSRCWAGPSARGGRAWWRACAPSRRRPAMQYIANPILSWPIALAAPPRWRSSGSRRLPRRRARRWIRGVAAIRGRPEYLPV
jgi:putative ABC transport system permease protein